jgi:predicted MFS family arabinose efflux permease
MRPASETAAEVEFTRGYANYVVFVLFVVYIFNFIDRQILTILLQDIKDELGVSDAAMGFLTGFAFAIFYTIAGIPIARWADTGTRRSIIALGLTAWSAMTALSGLAQNFTHLALARIGVGVGEAAASPPAHSLISDYFPQERRASALSFYNSGISFGVMFGLLIGGWINEFFNWRVAFFVVGVPGLGMALVLRYTVREPPRGYSERGPVDASTDAVADVARYLLSRRSFVYFALASGFTAFQAYGFGAWIPTFLRRVHEMGSGAVGTWFGLIAGIGGAAGAIFGGLLADRLGRRDTRWYLWVPALSTLAGYPFIFPFLLHPNEVVALVSLLPAVVFGSMYLGPTIAITHALVKVRMRALASAVLLFILNIIGLGAGPQAVGILNDVLDSRFGDEAVRYSLLIVSVMNLIAVTLFAVASRMLLRDLARKDAA